jgi:enamine deaminase RidA (YjgF/YER057c/UK114 family)
MSLITGVPYDYTAFAHGLIFTAGACPLHESGALVAHGDIEGQAERVVENLLAALRNAGAGAGDLLKTTIYVVSGERQDLVRAWNVTSRRLGRAPSTLLGVSVLGYEHQLVEIEAVARIP